MASSTIATSPSSSIPTASTTALATNTTSNSSECLNESTESPSQLLPVHDHNNSISQSSTNNESSTLQDSLDTSSSATYTPPSNGKGNGGRPKGSTNEKKRLQDLKIRYVTTEIVKAYRERTLNIQFDTKAKAKTFKEIVAEFRCKYDLPNEFNVPYRTVQTRVYRNRLEGNGRQSPLHRIEDNVISLIITMSKLKRSLKSSEGLKLINDLINNTQIQQDLINWKRSRRISNKNGEYTGTVGNRYWRRFLKRNRHRIRSKSGKKYAIDRADWTTYLNFWDMYNHIEDVLVNDSKIARKYPTPQWVDKEGNIVEDESQAYGMKATIDIFRPDMALACDEVGCNLSMENDSSVGGEKYLTSTKGQAYQTTATKDSHFTCLGFTRFDGEPLLCVVLIKGKKRDLMVETGIDLNCANGINGDIEKDNEYAFFDNNFGEESLFPGGPTCTYKGKEVRCFVKCVPSGGMDGETLTEILEELDSLGLYDDDRKEGMIPFLLLDGHQSRFYLKFLEYINDDKHRWNVCIGVPYGTSLWQIGDSSEQNGVFKMLMAIEKSNLFNARVDKYNQSIHLQRTDIMYLVKKTWPEAFGNVANNRKATAERGWYPYTRNLLLSDDIRASITSEQLKEEEQQGLFPYKRLGIQPGTRTTPANSMQSIMRNQIDSQNNSDQSVQLNFSGGGMAVHCSTTIMTAADREHARDLNNKRKVEGTTEAERLKTIKKKMTSGRMVGGARMFHLKKSIRDHVREFGEEVESEERNNIDRKWFTYIEWCNRADDILKKNGPEVLKWKRIKDMQVWLRPLCKDNEKMPILKADTHECVKAWGNRRRIVIDQDVMSRYMAFKETSGSVTEVGETVNEVTTNAVEEESGLTFTAM